MTEWYIYTYEEMKYLDAKDGDTVKLRNTFGNIMFLGVDTRKKISCDSGSMIISSPPESREMHRNNLMTYPSQAIYKPRAK